MVNSIYSVEDELDQMQSDKEDGFVFEPIYDEIEPKLLKLSESEAKVIKLQEDKISENGKRKKKEIEYWQITAKEVAQFRPCTETFIKR